MLHKPEKTLSITTIIGRHWIVLDIVYCVTGVSPSHQFNVSPSQGLPIPPIPPSRLHRHTLSPSHYLNTWPLTSSCICIMPSDAQFTPHILKKTLIFGVISHVSLLANHTPAFDSWIDHCYQVNASRLCKYIKKLIRVVKYFVVLCYMWWVGSIERYYIALPLICFIHFLLNQWHLEWMDGAK